MTLDSVEGFFDRLFEGDARELERSGFAERLRMYPAAYAALVVGLGLRELRVVGEAAGGETR